MNVDELTPATLTFAKALADATRQQIMQACCCEWCSVGELVDRVGVGQPTVSHHLAILREAGLVRVREQGRQTFYTLNQDSVAACCGRLIERFAPDTDLELRADEGV
jgi:DNA-binding transcriptional ArsR family regulator